MIKEYIKDNIALENNGEICEIDYLTVPEKEPHEIFAAGLEVNYSFVCKEKPEKLSVLIKFFVNFPLQTNKLTVYSIQNGISASPLVYKVLNPSYTSYDFDLEDIKTAVFVDSDGDGLSDEDELIYKTDPMNIDTDKDFYTDYEEVYGSWNPISAEISPGQNPRMELPESVAASIKPVM